MIILQSLMEGEGRHTIACKMFVLYIIDHSSNILNTILSYFELSVTSARFWSHHEKQNFYIRLYIQHHLEQHKKS